LNPRLKEENEANNLSFTNHWLKFCLSLKLRAESRTKTITFLFLSMVFGAWIKKPPIKGGFYVPRSEI
jgi:hypothetical protein